MKKYILFFCLFSISLISKGQKEDLSSIWSAKWIKSTIGPEKEFAVFHFRKTFDLDTIPENLVINTSGDNRYRLYVNDKYVCHGPLTGDLRHWYYETTDIKPFLCRGKNVISVTVLNYGSHPPDARLSVQTGFLLNADDKKFSFLNTNQTWKAVYDSAYTANKIDKSQINGYYGGGSREIVDGNKYIWDFSSTDLDDTLWDNAVVIENAFAKSCIWASRWKLTPRKLPTERLTVQRFQSVRMADKLSIPASFPKSKAAVYLPSNSKVRLVLDQGMETTAYPVLEISEGKNASIKMTYCEAAYIGNPQEKNKGNRNDVEGKTFFGYYDKYISDGGQNRKYSPLWWRAFRYLVLDIETQSAPLVIKDLHSVLSTYPFDQKSKLSLTGDVNKPVIDSIFNIGMRTLKLCSHETYVDCPYYEESQFEGDTRVEMLVSYYNFGDARLAENAIEQFAWSINDEGFLSARYPTNSLYYIPNFSIYWIGMLHDYLMYYDNKDFIRSKIQITRSIIQYFLARQQKDGSIYKPEYHNFVDWTFKNGEPLFDANGNSALVDLHVLMALQYAVDLEKSVGNEDFVKLYQKRIALLSKTIRAKYWSEKRQLFSDLSANNEVFSQHTNCMAILTGITKGEEAKEIMRKVLLKQGMTGATLYWSFYVFEAMQKAGLGDLYLDNLQIWEDLVAFGVTTWPETGINSRSECHGWGTSPNYHFFKITAGISSIEAGFNNIKIAPNFGKLQDINATIPHHNGFISLKAHKVGKVGIEAEIELPNNTKGLMEWNGKCQKLKAGKQKIKIN